MTPVGNDDDDPLSPSISSAERPLAARRTLIKADTTQSPIPTKDNTSTAENLDTSKEFTSPSSSSSTVKGN